jgi:hypothetical protein
MSIAIGFVSSVLDEHIKIADEKYCSMEKPVDFAESLRQSPDRLNFILKHLFFDKNADFRQFVNNSIVRNNGEMNSFRSEGKTQTAGQVIKESVTVEGVFWHDSFVFDFIKDVESFSPGFAKVTSIEIEKVGKVNLAKPIIKVLIQCEVFQAER